MTYIIKIHTNFKCIIKDVVVEAMQHFFTSGQLPKDLNHTFIALIQKMEGASKA